MIIGRFLLGTVICWCMSIEGMNLKSQEIMLCYPEKSKMILQPVSVDSFKEDSDSLYVSIDEFLDKKKLKLNQAEFAAFVGMYGYIIITDSEYNKVVSETILPEFRDFVKEDACSEVAGFYSDDQVRKFAKFLGDRLSILEALCAIGNYYNEVESIND